MGWEAVSTLWPQWGLVCVHTELSQVLAGQSQCPREQRGGGNNFRLYINILKIYLCMARASHRGAGAPWPAECSQRGR